MTQILSHNTYNNPILTDQAYYKTSDKYKFQNSADLINFIEGQGLRLKGTSRAGVRTDSKNGFQRHIMIFSNDSLQISDTEKLQFLVTNNHLGTESLKLNIGIYRTICANGLVVGTSHHQYKIDHKGSDFYEKLNYYMKKMIDMMPDIADNILKMKNVDLSSDQLTDFYNKLSEKRLENLKNVIKVDFRSYKPKRLGDYNDDLWTALNRGQETLIKGGLKYKQVGQNRRKEPALMNRTTKRISSIEKSMELNKFCWNEAIKLVA